MALIEPAHYTTDLSEEESLELFHEQYDTPEPTPENTDNENENAFDQ